MGDGKTWWLEEWEGCAGGSWEYMNGGFGLRGNDLANPVRKRGKISRLV